MALKALSKAEGLARPPAQVSLVLREAGRKEVRGKISAAVG